MRGKAEAFAHFGAAGQNDRWSWSAKSGDGKIVALALWKDLIDYKATPIAYSTYGRDHLPNQIDARGNKERIANLKWARDNCDGEFRVVITVARDVAAATRQIAEVYPHERMMMKLVDLDEETGDFSAVNVGVFRTPPVSHKSHK